MSKHHIGRSSLDEALASLLETIETVTVKQLEPDRRSHDGLVTFRDLHRLEKMLMSAISDFAAKMKAFQDREDAAVADLITQVKVLNDKITALQTSQGAITPEDQALLDSIQTQASSVADKLTALDNAPPAPAVPPTLVAPPAPPTTPPTP